MVAQWSGSGKVRPGANPERALLNGDSYRLLRGTQTEPEDQEEV